MLKFGNEFWSNYAIVTIGCRSLNFRNRQGAHSRPATHYLGGGFLPSSHRHGGR
jgi:hypothetical protein